MLYANDFNWVKANALETVLRELTDFKAGKKKKTQILCLREGLQLSLEEKKFSNKGKMQTLGHFLNFCLCLIFLSLSFSICVCFCSIMSYLSLYLIQNNTQAYNICVNWFIFCTITNSLVLSHPQQGSILLTMEKIISESKFNPLLFKLISFSN